MTTSTEDLTIDASQRAIAINVARTIGACEHAEAEQAQRIVMHTAQETPELFAASTENVLALELGVESAKVLRLPQAKVRELLTDSIAHAEQNEQFHEAGWIALSQDDAYLRIYLINLSA